MKDPLERQKLLKERRELIRQRSALTQEAQAEFQAAEQAYVAARQALVGAKQQSEALCRSNGNSNRFGRMRFSDLRDRSPRNWIASLNISRTSGIEKRAGVVL